MVRGQSIWTPEENALFPRQSHLRRRVREMPQCDWPKNLATVAHDKHAAGIEPHKDLAGRALLVEKEGNPKP